MQTAKAIKQFIIDNEKDDFFGVMRSDVGMALPYADAKKLFDLKNVKKIGWDKNRFDTDEKVVKAITKYLPFAWDKATNERGISANRSIQHFQAWFFLIDTEFYKTITEMFTYNYEPYGKPILKAIEEWLKNRSEKA